MAFVTTNAYINPQETKTNQKQQKKRKRAVRNAFIQLDDVKETAGDNYINWIKITKQKLLERESKLMSRRANIIQDTINKQIDKFKYVNARMKIYIDIELYENIINQQLLNNCLQKLNSKLINPWKGIVLHHTKHTFDSFRKYFTTSRSWFDQRKRSVLAQYLWMPIFDAVKQFIKIAAKRYFNERFFELQTEFVESLLLQIATSVFKQKIKLPSTRPHSLISCSILKECHIFQAYLKTHIHKDILVNTFLQNNPEMTAVTLMGLVIDKLQIMSNESGLNFQRDVYQLYDEFHFTPVYVEPLVDYSQNITNYSYNRNKQINNNCNTNNNKYYGDDQDDNDNGNDTCNDTASCISYITNDSMMFINTIPITENYDESIENQYYKPFHSQSYEVSSKRFSPLW
eukprot:69958_1